MARVKSHLHANNAENKKAIETSDKLVTEERSFFLYPNFWWEINWPLNPFIKLTITTVAQWIKFPLFYSGSTQVCRKNLMDI